jgi:glycoside hydrolase-like protein
MTTFGVDYAFAPHPTVNALKSSGATFVVRYIGSKDYTKSRSEKWLSPAEAKALHDAGIAVCVVFETAAKRAEDGHDAGAEDAAVCVKELAYCGLPADMPVYFAVDYDTTVGPHITAYLQGAAEVLGLARVGVYAGYKVVKACLDKKLVAYAWQTYAWSGGKWDPRAHLQQYSNGHKIGNATVDYDRAMVADYGQWPRPSKPLPPAPKPVKDVPTPDPKLRVDGKWGSATTKALQTALNHHGAKLKVDGALGQVTARALQHYLGVVQDGDLGPKTVRALQKHVGAKVDGQLGPLTVKALQTRLNAGRF